MRTLGPLCANSQKSLQTHRSISFDGGAGYQFTSRSGVEPMRWIDRSAPSNSSSWLRRRPTSRLQDAVDHEPRMASAQATPTTRADQLRGQAHAAQAAQRLAAEDAGRDAAPGAAQAVQRPHAQHVVDLPAVLRQREHHDEDGAGDARRRPRRPADASGPSPRTPPPGRPAGRCGRSPGRFGRSTRAASVPPTMAISELTATRPDILSMVCALITLKPNQPTVRIHAPSARNGMFDGGWARDRAVLAVAVAARAQQQHGRQREPAAHRVDHDRAGEVMELRAGQRLDPGLHAEALVPGDAFEQRIDQADDDGGGHQLRPEPGALGDAAGNDGRDGGGESQQEEELHQLVAVASRPAARRRRRSACRRPRRSRPGNRRRSRPKNPPGS